MTLSSLVPPSLSLSLSEAGFDYFATQAHYRSLANRIITALGGFTVVVVTGDPLPSASTLSIALDEAGAGRHTVIGFSCGPEHGRRDVLRFRRALLTSLASGDAPREEPGRPALIVFDDTDRLSDEEIEEIFRHVHQDSRIGDHGIAAAILLSRPKFLTRLERPVLSFWLAKHLFVARLRFQELGVDEVSTFIRHQLPSREKEIAFNDKAVAAIASVSGGDPMVVNRFSRRMLDSVAASTGGALLKARVDSAAVVQTDVPPKECVTTFKEGPRQNLMATPLSTRMWRDRGLALKLCAGTVFCFACVALAATVVHIHPVEENIAASNSASPKNSSAKVSEDGALASWVVLPEASGTPPAESPPEEPTAAPGQGTLTATTAPAAPTPEDALAVEMPALSPSIAAVRPTAQMAAPTEAPETIVSTAVPLAALPTGAAPIATAVSPTGMPTPNPTTSVPGSPPAQLRLPAAEVAALLARGDELFALGDISSARLFYERAVDAGEGRAAIRLGNTFDPAFLNFAHLRMRGDATMAVFWYGRARDLGAAEVEILLKRLKPVSSR